MRDPGLGTDEIPDQEGDDRNHHNGRNEPGGDLVGQRLDRCARPLGVGHHPDDLRQHRVAADPLGTHQQAPRAVHGCSGDLVPRDLLDRHRLAADHRFIDGTATLDNDAVNRDLFARPDAQHVVHMDMLERDVLLYVSAHTARGLRSKAQQRPDRLAGRRSRAKLKHLP